jgi:hypothetical protein
MGPGNVRGTLADDGDLESLERGTRIGIYCSDHRQHVARRGVGGLRPRLHQRRKSYDYHDAGNPCCVGKRRKPAAALKVPFHHSLLVLSAATVV